MMNGYNYDSISNTLTVTAAFLKKASVLNSAEYKTIRQFRSDNPGLKIEKKGPVAMKNREHHIKLKDMKDWLVQYDLLQGTNYLDQYRLVYAMSKIQPSPYKYIETWFKKTFPNWMNQMTFDKDGQMSFVIENKPADQEGQDPAGKAAQAEEAQKAA